MVRDEIHYDVGNDYYDLFLFLYALWREVVRDDATNTGMENGRLVVFLYALWREVVRDDATNTGMENGRLVVFLYALWREVVRDVDTFEKEVDDAYGFYTPCGVRWFGTLARGQGL